jgi:hypothetical protein
MEVDLWNFVEVRISELLYTSAEFRMQNSAYLKKNHTEFRKKTSISTT